MPANPAGDDASKGSRNPNEPSDTQSPSSTPPPSQPPLPPFRHKSNAPYSSYPPLSNHEYPPRATPISSKDAEGSHDPRAPILAVPPLVTLRGRPTPRNRPPNQNDERCFIYCTQTAARRSVGQQPICKTWCWRRLYPQDYTTVEAPAPQQTQGTSSMEGETTTSGGSQTSTIVSPGATNGASFTGRQGNVLTMPDGRTVMERRTFEMKPGIFGFDGRFVYFGRSRFRAKDRLDSMSHPGLSEDWHVDEMVKKDDPRKEDEEYMDFLRRYHYSTQIEVAPIPSQLFTAISDKFSELMKPATKYVESFAPGGAQERFALKVWDKAKTGDGWVLFKDASAKLWEEAKKMEAEERDKKNGGNGKGNSGGTSMPPTTPSSPSSS